MHSAIIIKSIKLYHSAMDSPINQSVVFYLISVHQLLVSKITDIVGTYQLSYNLIELFHTLSDLEEIPELPCQLDYE
jgi:hypothetical protein